MTDIEALCYAGPREARLEPVVFDGPPGPDEVEIRALASGLSRGTERLVFEGRVPESERERMRAPMQRGAFPFPVRYGYALVGVVEHGPSSLLGRRVFALHPHQSRARLPAAACVLVPDAVPTRRATLAANMETALNALWDSGLAPGDRVFVVGAGLVGCLVARLAARTPGCEVLLTDKIASRAAAASELRVTFHDRPDPPQGCDLAFDCSSSEAGLAAAMNSLGLEGKLIEMSWHGDREVNVPLGGSFHSQRLSLISSQVGRIPAARAARWTFGRRLAKAMELLDDPALDVLLTDAAPFADLPARLPDLLAPDAPGIATVIDYP